MPGRDDRVGSIHSIMARAQAFLKTPGEESTAKFSPDGKWLVYMSDESGRREVYVQPYPGSGGKWQISTDGGQERGVLGGWSRYHANGQAVRKARAIQNRDDAATTAKPSVARHGDTKIDKNRAGAVHPVSLFQCNKIIWKIWARSYLWIIPLSFHSPNPIPSLQAIPTAPQPSRDREGADPV